MWELDKKLLQAHALPLVVGYTFEMATAMRGLDMDESLPQELLQAAGEASRQRAAVGGLGVVEHGGHRG